MDLLLAFLFIYLLFCYRTSSNLLPDFANLTTPTGKSINFPRLSTFKALRPCSPCASPARSPSPEREFVPRHCSASDTTIRSSSVGRRGRRNAVVTMSGIVGGGIGVVAFAGPHHGKKQLRSRKVGTSSGGAGVADSPEKWPTTFLDQLRTLTHRNFTQSRDIYLSKFLMIKNVLLAFLVGLLWFQTSHEEIRINDIRGVVSILI